ncbi:hypothetical protein PG989_001270 [Apiospora arundinis]
MRTITSTPEDDSRMESVAEILFKTMVKLRLEGNGGEHNEQDEPERMASPEAYDIPEESPDELLDENMKEPNSSPVLEGSCTSDPAYPPETCVEPEWVDASEQDSKITSDTLTSETYSEVQPDGSLGHGVRAFGETPEIIQEFDWTLSSESKAGNTTKGAQSAMVNETMELPVESAACEIRPNADLINVARLSMESSSPPPKTQGDSTVLASFSKRSCIILWRLKLLEYSSSGDLMKIMKSETPAKMAKKNEVGLGNQPTLTKIDKLRELKAGAIIPLP